MRLTLDFQPPELQGINVLIQLPLPGNLLQWQQETDTPSTQVQTVHTSKRLDACGHPRRSTAGVSSAEQRPQALLSPPSIEGLVPRVIIWTPTWVKEKKTASSV